MIVSGHIEQQPFGQHPSIRQSADSMQIGGNYRNSAQYGARHESSSFETADSSSPRQASLDIPTNTISRGLDSHQTNHYSHRQLQASYSYPHPAYVGYGNLGQSAAIYPPPPGFPSYPTYASQNFGYGFAPQQSSRNPPGQAANYVQDTSNPGTATFSSSALAHNRTAFRPSTRGDFETPDEDDNNVRSRRLPRSMDQEEVPHSRVRPRRRRPSPRRRTISRRSAHTSRSKKETVKHEASTPSDTPHTIDPVVNEMIERFQRRQPEVRQKQRPSYVSRGTWSTREEAFVSYSPYLVLLSWPSSYLRCDRQSSS